MERKKNGFFTFIFSLLPGAGEMYLGFMKRGTSMMSLFFFVLAVSSLTRMGFLLFVVPVIWFYSFFQVHNFNSMSQEELADQKDEYLWITEDNLTKKIFSRFHKLIAWILIFMGVVILWRNLSDLIVDMIPAQWSNQAYWVIDEMGNTVPQLLVAGLIIYFGIYLIKGKKKELGGELPCGKDE